MKKDLPILIISGQDDPAGKKGKGVEKLYGMYLKYNFKHVNMRLYPMMRHEVLNEIEKIKVFNDVLDFFKV